MIPALALSPDDRRRVRLFCLVALGLALAHVAVMLLYFGDVLGEDDWIHVAFFDLDEEESFGTWFSAVLLLYAGRLLWAEARIDGPEPAPWRRHWLVLAIGFHFLSIDEVAGMHEYLNTVVEDTRWTTFGAAIVAVLGLAYLPFLRALPARIRFLFVAAALLYVGGAVGVERGTDWYENEGLLDTLGYNLWTAVEETMEMFGVILFIYALSLREARRKAKAA